MPQIPQYQRETKLNGTALPYQHLQTTPEMFGAAQAKATANAANGMNELANAALRISNTIEETKVMAFNNAVEQWRQDNLLDKENGYLSKQGQDAAGKSPDIMKNYDAFVENWKSNNKVSNFSAKRIEAISGHKRSSILYNATNHDLRETNTYATTQGKIGVENAINNAVTERNNPEAIKMQIANINKIAEWKGELQNSDATTIAADKKDNISKLYSSIIAAQLEDGDIESAKKTFEEHKSEINSELHSKFIGAIKNEDDKYKSRAIANDIIAKAKDEQDAYALAESIEDVNMSDAVLSRVKRHYSEQEHFKNQAEKESLNAFYTKAVEAAKNGGTLSYDDIPDNLDPDVKLSLMNYVNTKGQPETDNEVWETLYNKSVNDAQGFAKEDLNKYRGFLSDSEYKSFLKKQQEIQAGEFYTQIKDDDKMIDAALKSMGLSGNNSVFGLTGKNKDIAYSEIRHLVREFEARKGRKITDTELQNITNSLGYKDQQGNQIYKQLEKGMREKVGFIRDVVNDITYYQSKHNGQLPSDEEKAKIIQNRLNQKVQEKKSAAQNMVSTYSNNALTMRNIAYTTPKANEQKVLTYFADNQLPTIEKQLNMKLTVTSRYRNQVGSHHREGRAADISMSEHSVANRIKIIERLANLSTVHAIGTSDPNILAHFAGNPKIVDERKYDRQHGTNHVNHSHITLINANPATPNTQISNKPQNGIYKF